MRLKALAEIYTIHSFAQLCDLNFIKIVARIFVKKQKNTSAIFNEKIEIRERFQNGAKECIV